MTSERVVVLFVMLLSGVTAEMVALFDMLSMLMGLSMKVMFRSSSRYLSALRRLSAYCGMPSSLTCSTPEGSSETYCMPVPWVIFDGGRNWCRLSSCGVGIVVLSRLELYVGGRISALWKRPIAMFSQYFPWVISTGAPFAYVRVSLPDAVRGIFFVCREMFVTMAVL